MADTCEVCGREKGTADDLVSSRCRRGIGVRDDYIRCYRLGYERAIRERDEAQASVAVWKTDHLDVCKERGEFLLRSMRAESKRDAALDRAEKLAALLREAGSWISASIPDNATDDGTGAQSFLVRIDSFLCTCAQPICNRPVEGSSPAPNQQLHLRSGGQMTAARRLTPEDVLALKHALGYAATDGVWIPQKSRLESLLAIIDAAEQAREALRSLVREEGEPWAAIADGFKEMLIGLSRNDSYDVEMAVRRLLVLWVAAPTLVQEMIAPTLAKLDEVLPRAPPTGGAALQEAEKAEKEPK